MLFLGFFKQHLKILVFFFIFPSILAEELERRLTFVKALVFLIAAPLLIFFFCEVIYSDEGEIWLFFWPRYVRLPGFNGSTFSVGKMWPLLSVFRLHVDLVR